MVFLEMIVLYFGWPNQPASSGTRTIFTITAEIYARSLANFYCQYADRHINLKFMRDASASKSGQFDNLLS